MLHIELAEAALKSLKIEINLIAITVYKPFARSKYFF